MRPRALDPALLPPNDSLSRSNWLRAAVLGANDGIISLAALVVGVAGATNVGSHILVTGIAGLFAGAFSMAVGEYVSVSSQRDIEKSLLEKERRELAEHPKEEFNELVGLYEQKGLSTETAERVATELTKHDVFKAHVEAELGINAMNLTNPWQAAAASAAAFSTGALIPLLAILVPAPLYRVPVTFAAVFVALIATGVWSARMSRAPVLASTVRVVLGGIIAMLVTFGIGSIVGSFGA